MIEDPYSITSQIANVRRYSNMTSTNSSNSQPYSTTKHKKDTTPA